MTTTTTSSLSPIIPLPEGTLIHYTYPRGGEMVMLVGTKGPAVNPGANGGFRVLDPETGKVIGTISRYSRVTVLAEMGA